MNLKLDIESLWNELVPDQPFDRASFAEKVLMDCGHDGSTIDVAQIKSTLDGASHVDHGEVLWAFGEAIQVYAAEIISDPAEFVRAVFVAATLVEGVRSGGTIWALHFDSICRLLCSPTPVCDMCRRGELLRQLTRPMYL